MLKFNKNKPQTFKCKVEIQGADSPKVTPRLILSSKKNNMKLFFEGKYENNSCEIVIPSMVNIEKSGEVTLEIIANDTVFQPWQSTYEILSETVVVENVELIDNKNEITVKVIQESDKEDKKELIESKYYQPIKNAKNKKKLLAFIKDSYIPNKKIFEWANKEFNDTKSIKSKMAMYCKEKKLI